MVRGKQKASEISALTTAGKLTYVTISSPQNHSTQRLIRVMVHDTLSAT